MKKPNTTESVQILVGALQFKQLNFQDLAAAGGDLTFKKNNIPT